MDRSGKKFESLDFENQSFKPSTLSIVEPPTVEFKLLPLHLKYVYLGDNSTLLLLDVLRRSKKALGWTIADIKGIIPTICIHKSLLEDFHNNSIENRKG
ncbi:RNA-directed DNA polymerase-like protein [Gossypium australe]|uniref:RNA-directed DNA polymerase-like protein n=1 Tax=Gossypium australe TaxID=47621 RepID=A0A5B6VYH5_9ROSI|nr:RNA-directed DNA polymerase-like protein [Gossypium australe]